MERLIDSITDHYRERMQRLALFDPLYTLQNKKTKDAQGRPIDYFGLGLLSLLFFFENMLIRNKKTGVKELALFLKTMAGEEIDFDDGGFEKLSRTIIEAFRPPSGRRNARQFYNWQTKQNEEVHYAILKASKSDTKTNTQYYTLDEQGLELIFATKEYFSEFQLSINQLVLRKQLEKGEFVGALRQIDEMHIDVATLRDRMTRIKHEIQRNIISNETYERYKTIVEDINRRLEREHEEFDELQSFVRETKDKLGYDLKHEKEQRTYGLIVKIDKELGEVHHQHRRLLEESITLKTSALQAAEESLYYVGIDAFNFEQEILGKLISHPLPLQASRTLIEPLLSLEKTEVWSPLTVFAEQRVTQGESEEKMKTFLDLADEEQKREDLRRQQKNFTKIMAKVLELLGDRDEVTLKEVIDYMRHSQDEQLLHYRLFYDFWLILHQKSPLNLEADEQTESIFTGVIDLLRHRADTLSLIEADGIVQGTPRYSIKNMVLRLEVKSDGLSAGTYH